MDDKINIVEKKSSLSPITEEDYNIIKKILEIIKNDKNSIHFKYPMDTEINIDYLRVINYRPMDLSEIERKLENKEYSLVKDVIDDIKLIWYNCRVYNTEFSKIFKISKELEQLADKELKKYYIYYDKINKSVNYKEQYEKNFYKEEAFTDPDYLEKTSTDMSEKDKNLYIFLYYKIKLKRLLAKLNNEETKILYSEIKENNEKNELNFLNKYVEENTKSKPYFKFNIENMMKEDILFLINYINNRFSTSLDEKDI